MAGFRWIATPGHTPGHVSLYREADGTLIVGDAFVTTRQESAVGAFQQVPEVRRPPAYYTPDWKAARQSVEKALRCRVPMSPGRGTAIPCMASRCRGSSTASCANGMNSDSRPAAAILRGLRQRTGGRLRPPAERPFKVDGNGRHRPGTRRGDPCARRRIKRS